MHYDSVRAHELLRLGTQNPDAAFRDGQEEAIEHLVEGRGRLLVVQKTGWGKSSVYFIATALLREQGAGPALLISPLLALMRNQILSAQRMGVRAVTINSENRDEWDAVSEQIARDEVDILLISPERLANDQFRKSVLRPIGSTISMLVVDEAHCISDWGHDFRPQYRLLENIVRKLPPTLRLLATTATANNRVLEDLATVLGPNLTVSKGDLSRPSLFLQTIRMPSQAERLAWLAERVPELPGNGIIYTLTIRDAEQVARWLRSHGIDVEAYTGETGAGREELENALLGNRVKALVATTALGMGFDKPDLGFVIHYQSPGSVVAYYQQVGRAGRALKAAYGVVLSGVEEGEITGYFIESAFPSREEVAEVIDALGSSRDGLSIYQLLDRVNARKGRIDRALLLLSLESPTPIVKQGTKWMLSGSPLSDAFWERAERLTRLRREEQKQMQEYVGLASGHMEFLIRALDGDPNGFRPPALEPLPTSADPALVGRAVEFLQGGEIVIEPRKMWPTGGLADMNVKGKIPEHLQLSAGRALSIAGDAGWGKLVGQGMQEGLFSDELLDACIRLIEGWKPDPAPTWVTAIPSLRHRDLVPGFAMRLAERLGLPFHPVLTRIAERPPQKELVNSMQQARNVDGAFAMRTSIAPEGPVLLVDDLVDSRWTLTVAGYLLKKHGSGPVFPLALAERMGG
jgi:ATP-dependent DNA helicase RecQ